MSMEDSLKQLWMVCLWYFGISTTITVCIFGWIIKLGGAIAQKQDLDEIANELRSIRSALVGDYDKKGLVTRNYELEERITKLEKG